MSPKSLDLLFFTTEDVLQKTDVLDPILAQNIIDIVEMEANSDILV